MSKPIRELTISKDSTIRQAMEAIQRGACGMALVMDEDRRLLGVMTDGDVRRAVLAGAALSDHVAPYMVKKFTAVSPKAGRSEVLDLMQARTLSQIPIVDAQGKLVGLHLLREILGAVERPNWAVVMAGGRGQRLRPLTDTIPKPMLKVAGRPILERIILHLVGFGIRRIFISVNYLSDLIEQHFRDGAAHGCAIEYLREREPLGTGGSLGLLPETPQHPLLVLNGDLVTQFDVGAMLAHHAAGRYRATVGVHKYAHTVPYGVIEIADGRVVHLCEKPTLRWPTNAGVYVLEPALLERIPADTLYPITALVEDCLEKGEPVGAFDLDEDWLDVGQHQELRHARGEEKSP